MRKFCWITTLSFTLIASTSCQKEMSDTQRFLVIVDNTRANSKPSSVLEAEAIQETIEELQQQGLIK